MTYNLKIIIEIIRSLKISKKKQQSKEQWGKTSKALHRREDVFAPTNHKANP